jgi:hypothetical protein
VSRQKNFYTPYSFFPQFPHGVARREDEYCASEAAGVRVA